MPGFSITLLLLPQENALSSPSASLILSLLDDKPEVPGWKWSSGTPPPVYSTPIPTTKVKYDQVKGSEPLLLKAPDPKSFLESLERACKALVAAEPEITRMDSIAGDGDCGLTLKVHLLGDHLTLSPFHFYLRGWGTYRSGWS